MLREAILGATHYLDTGCFRDPAVVGIDAALCRTSALTLIELINGIDADDREFGRRATAIRRVFDSGVRIDWRSPDEIQLAAFGATRYAELKIEPLRVFVDMALQAPSRATGL